jgi:hypothetical protein
MELTKKEFLENYGEYELVYDGTFRKLLSPPIIDNFYRHYFDTGGYITFAFHNQKYVPKPKIKCKDADPCRYVNIVELGFFCYMDK